MARVRFLTTSADPRPGHEGTVYGPLHETDIDETDVDYVKSLRLEGKCEVIDATGLPAEMQPLVVESPVISDWPAPTAP